MPDALWVRFSPLLPGQTHTPGVTATDMRLFAEAIPWRLRCGIPWRALPERFGPWYRVFVRFSRCKNPECPGRGPWPLCRTRKDEPSSWSIPRLRALQHAPAESLWSRLRPRQQAGLGQTAPRGDGGPGGIKHRCTHGPTARLSD